MTQNVLRLFDQKRGRMHAPASGGFVRATTVTREAP